MCGKQGKCRRIRAVQKLRIICLFFSLNSLMVSYTFIIMIGIDKKNISSRRRCALTWKFCKHSKPMKNSLENTAAIHVKKNLIYFFQNNHHHPNLDIRFSRRNQNPQMLCLAKSKHSFCGLDIPIIERSYYQNFLLCFLSSTELQGCQVILNTAHNRIRSGHKKSARPKNLYYHF